MSSSMRGGPEIDEPVEGVGDIGLRLDIVELASFNQRSDAGPVFGSLVISGEERIFAIEHDRPDSAFDDVGVELDAVVIEEADEPFPMVEAIAQILGEAGLAGRRRGDPAAESLGGDCLVGGVAVALDDAPRAASGHGSLRGRAHRRSDRRRVRSAPRPIVAGDRPEIALLDLAEVRMSSRRRS
jgi:hypothetical protein